MARGRNVEDDEGGSGIVHWVLLGISGLVWLIVAMATFNLGTIQPDEVGVLVNNLFRSVTVYENAETLIYNAITSDLILLDKREQTIDFKREDANADDDGSREGIRVKTRDGSDVEVDVTVNYAIIPAKAAEVVANSGPGHDRYGHRWDGYKDHWIRDYAHAICRYELGALSTEEFYDSVHRTNAADKAKEDLNRILGNYGLRINSVQVQHFEFYREYQEKISQKTLADQEVEAEKSQKLAAEQAQKTRQVEAEKVRDVRVATVKGDLEKVKLSAEAQAQKIQAEADSAYVKAEMQAGAIREAAEIKANAVRTSKLKEAEGIKAFQDALASREGALNLVMLEYAKRMKDMTFRGTATVLDGSVTRFERRDVPANEGR